MTVSTGGNSIIGWGLQDRRKGTILLDWDVKIKENIAEPQAEHCASLKFLIKRWERQQIPAAGGP